MVNFHRFYKILILVNVITLSCLSLLEDNAIMVCAFSGDENVSTSNEGLLPKANPNTEDDIGPVLHAWCWRFKDVSRYINEISRAGFKSVQVSPVQPAKVTDDEKRDDLGKKKMFRTWWSLYQPLDFKVGNCLGTEEDFKEMCDTAHRVGIKIIVDIVANHLAESETGEVGYCRQINQALITAVGVNCLFHEKGFEKREDCGFQNREQMTHYSLGGAPDLDTGNKTLQGIIINFLQQLISLGADGFRFDAAKHIELPEDEEPVRSDFWPNVINAIKEKKSDLFIYGEVLHDDNENNIKIGEKSIEESYLKYMNITDSQMGDSVCRAIREKNADIVNIGYCGGSIETDPGHFVTWVESHDNYKDRKTIDLNFDRIKLGWAIIASRAGSVPLYLARPMGVNFIDKDCNVVMCGPGDLWWTDRIITEINKFRAVTKGEGEYIIKYGNDVIIILRGRAWVVVVNLSDFEKDICVNVGFENEIEKKIRLASGTYTDAILKSSFDVDAGGNLRGKISGKSVAVLYYKFTNPSVYVAGGKKYEGKIEIPISWVSNCIVTYRLNNGEEFKLEGITDSSEGKITIGEGLKVGTKTVLTLTGSVSSDVRPLATITYTQNYIFEKCMSCKSIVKIMDNNEGRCRLYCYTLNGKGELTEICKWDEAPELEEDGNGYFSRELCSDQQVLINYFEKGTQFPGRMQPGIIVHIGEEVIIDGESVQVNDLQSASVSNIKVVPLPNAAVDVSKADQSNSDIVHTVEKKEVELKPRENELCNN